MTKREYIIRYIFFLIINVMSLAYLYAGFVYAMFLGDSNNSTFISMIKDGVWIPLLIFFVLNGLAHYILKIKLALYFINLAILFIGFCLSILITGAIPNQPETVSLILEICVILTHLIAAPIYNYRLQARTNIASSIPSNPVEN